MVKKLSSSGYKKKHCIGAKRRSIKQSCNPKTGRFHLNPDYVKHSPKRRRKSSRRRKSTSKRRRKRSASSRKRSPSRKRRSRRKVSHRSRRKSCAGAKRRSIKQSCNPKTGRFHLNPDYVKHYPKHRKSRRRSKSRSKRSKSRSRRRRKSRSKKRKLLSYGEHNMNDNSNMNHLSPSKENAAKLSFNQLLSMGNCGYSSDSDSCYSD